MKPRIWRVSDFFAGQQWRCAVLDRTAAVRVGRGKTPAEAYRSWLHWKPYVNVGVSA